MLATALFWICLSSGSLAGGEEVVYRSLRAEGHDQLDELDLPRRTQRVCHWGWEVRTRHFVVFSTTSQEQATWTAREMEQAWSDAGRLADEWTDVHRQPSFGVGAVGVWVTDRPLHPRSQPAAGPRKTNYTPDIYVNLAEGTLPLRERGPNLRREAFLAFLRVAGQDQVFPDWVQEGLAAYFAGQQPPDESIERLDPPETASHRDRGVWARRLEADRMAPLVEDRPAAMLWVRYLLEGNDAEQADAFFTALRATAAGQQQDPFFPGDGVYGVVRFENRVPPETGLPLKQLTTGPAVQQEVSEWLADRDIGQPIVETSPDEMPLDERQREMVLILKLARRFAQPAVVPIQPEIHEFGADRTTSWVSEPPPAQPLSVSTLYQRLSDPESPRWATIDTDGSLLLARDRRRMAEVFANPNRRYRTYLRDGQTVLEAAFATGDVFEAWLEENPDNPKRPIVHVQQVPARG